MSTTPIPTFSTGIIPVGIGNLVQLEQLYLDNTKLSGTCAVPLPLGYYGWSRHDDHKLRCDSNPRTTRAHFTGSIPPEIGGLVALTYLGLFGTSVEGASILYTIVKTYFKLWFVQDGESCDSQ